MRGLFKGVLAAGVALATITAAQTKVWAAEVKELNWGLLAVESQDNLMKRWGPIIKLIEAKMDIPVNPFFASDYTGVIEAMRFKKVDVVLFGNKSAMTAVDRAGAEVFAQMIEKDGSRGYHSILVTHKDNASINSLEDVLKCGKSINFGIGDPQSTSGFLVPTTFIFAANKVNPRDCFRTVRNASHEANLLSVANKLVNVATANNRAMYFRLKRNKPEAFEQLKEVWRSPLIAADPFAWRKDLPKEVKAKIHFAFMSLGRIGDDPAQLQKEREALQNGGFGGFVPSSNLQLLPFREMELNRQMLRIQADETRTPAEKSKMIAELQEKAAEIRKMAKSLPNM